MPRRADVLAALALAILLLPAAATAPAVPPATRAAALAGDAHAALYVDGDAARAIRLASEARDLAAGSPGEEADALVVLSAAHIEAGDPTAGLQAAGAALAAARRAGDGVREARALQQEGNASYYLGRHADALDRFRRAASLMEGAGDLRGLASCRKDVAITLRTLGHYDDAIVELHRVSEALEALGDDASLHSALGNLGTAYELVGAVHRAEACYLRALEIAGRQPPAAGADLRARLGYLYAGAGNPVAARQQFEGALSQVEGTDAHTLVMWTLMGLTFVLADLGEPEAARATGERALALARASGVASAESDTIRNLAELALPQDPRRALELAGEAIRLQAGGRRHWPTLLLAARAASSLGDTAAARRHLEDAVALLEEARALIRDPDQRAGFAARNPGAYRELALLHASGPAPDDPERALRVLEESRGRRSEQDKQRPFIAPRGTATVAYLLHRDTALAFVVGEAPVAAVRLPASPRQIRARVETMLALLDDPGTPSDDVEAVAMQLHADLVAPVLQRIPAGTERLRLVPDGALWHVPFDALHPPGGPYLVERFAVSYATSVLEEPAPAAGPAGGSVAVIVSPRGADLSEDARVRAGLARQIYEDEGLRADPIPATVRESVAIARVAGPAGVLLSGPHAAEGRIKALPMARFSVLHVATHGLLSSGSPERSALLLAPGPDPSEDGYLMAREIEALHVPVDLVVLAACRTARGRVLQGEGVESLARAFMRAGARSVVASVAPVEDGATAALMTLFYGALSRGSGKADALRSAKLALLGDPATRSPRAWATFVLVGEPAGRIALPSSAGATRRGPFLAALVALLSLAAPRLAARAPASRRPALG